MAVSFCPKTRLITELSDFLIKIIEKMGFLQKWWKLFYSWAQVAGWHDLELFNKALVLKQAWRLLQHCDSLGLRANSVGATVVRVVAHRFIYDRTLGCQGLHPSHNNGEVTMVRDIGNILSENI